MENEVFEPEKVWHFNTSGDGTCVSAFDYDKLLAIYNEVRGYAISLEKSYLIDHPNHAAILQDKR